MSEEIINKEQREQKQGKADQEQEQSNGEGGVQDQGKDQGQKQEQGQDGGGRVEAEEGKEKEEERKENEKGQEGQGQEVKDNVQEEVKVENGKGDGENCDGGKEEEEEGVKGQEEDEEASNEVDDGRNEVVSYTCLAAVKAAKIQESTEEEEESIEEETNEEEEEEEEDDEETISSTEEEQQQQQHQVIRAVVVPRVITAKMEEVPDLEEEDEEDEEEEEEEEDPMAAEAAAAKARGDVDKWVKRMDELDPCHKLRSLCKKGDIRELTELLESGSPGLDIDSLSEEHWTSLHEIITHECQFTEVAKVLLKFGANVNTQDKHGDSPLHSALLYHNTDNIALLLEHNADLSLINAGGRMPIHVASEVDALKLLIGKGADPNVQDLVGNSPLHYAVADKDKERAKFLVQLESINVNLANEAGSTPLHLTSGDSELANLLLEAGANPNLPDMNANTPLHLAVRGRHKESVKLMLEKKGDTSLANTNGKTPLNMAKDKNMKNILLGKGDAAASTPGSAKSRAKASAASEYKSPDIVIPKCLSPGILKRKRSEGGEDGDGSAKKGPRLRFSDVNDYSGVEVVEVEEKRVKVTPIYSELVFSSDEDE